MSDFETKVAKIAQDTYDQNAASDQFGVSQVGYHRHTGNDAPKISFTDLKNRFEFLNEVLPGSSAATAGNYGAIFIAPYPCIFMGATEVHGALGTDGGAVTLQIEKLIGTSATGSGINLLASGFNLKGTINTVQTAILGFLPNLTFNLKKGDRLGLSLTGTPTSVSQVVIVVQLSY